VLNSSRLVVLFSDPSRHPVYSGTSVGGFGVFMASLVGFICPPLPSFRRFPVCVRACKYVLFSSVFYLLASAHRLLQLFFLRRQFVTRKPFSPPPHRISLGVEAQKRQAHFFGLHAHSLKPLIPPPAHFFSPSTHLSTSHLSLPVLIGSSQYISLGSLSCFPQLCDQVRALQALLP